jgi:hypothetical protein
MKLRRTHTLPAFLLAAALGGTSLLRPAAPAPPAAAGARATPARTAIDTPREAARVEAQRLVYAAALTQRIEVGRHVGADVRIAGRWSLTPVPGTRIVEARLDDATVEGHGAPEVPREALRQPVLLVHDEAGRLVGLRFAREAPAGARALLTGLASLAQYTAGAGEAWEVDEVDAAGPFHASYRREGRSVRRSKRGYAALHAGGSTRMTLEGEGRIVVGGDGLVEALDAREATRAEIGEGMAPITGALGATLRLVDRGPARAADVEAAERRIATHGPASMGVRDDDEAAQRRADERRAAGAKLGDLRRAFAESDGEPDTDARGRRRAALLERSAAVLRLDPAQSLEAGKQLARPGVKDADADFFAAALGAAGTEEATAALADVLAAPDATGDAHRHAAVSLAQSSFADAHTIDALRTAASSDDALVREAATLALGAQARTLQQAGDQGADLPDPAADLLAAYAAAGDAAARRLALEALGNSGNGRALDVIRAELGSPALAPTAAYALRFMPAPVADDLLVELVASPDPSLRRAAWAAVYYRDAALWAPRLKAALAMETDPQVSAAIEAALGRAHG